ncbi:MAG: HEAT repeat domain-containing protein [Candidatus Moduliflexus flocculans]|nr:HEAT repeat domain-containing protein [Candidatus Moduliflexus flocculans]
MRTCAAVRLKFWASPRAIEIPTLIESAFERADPAWVASALRAMGHSQDERWNEDVIGKLLDEETLIKAAAVEAAGMLGIQEAVPILIQLLDDEEEDDDVAAAAIWSLSQIGGDEARTYLVGLADQTEDEELVRLPRRSNRKPGLHGRLEQVRPLCSR